MNVGSNYLSLNITAIDSTAAEIPTKAPITVEEMTRRLICASLRRACSAAASEARALRLEAQKTSGAERHALNLERVGGRGERRHLHLASMWARGRSYASLESQPKDLSYDVAKTVRGNYLWDLVIAAYKRVCEEQVSRAARNLPNITPTHPMQAFAGRPLPFGGWLDPKAAATTK